MYKCESCKKGWSAEKLMPSNCGAGKDSWESLGLQDQTSKSWKKSTLAIHWNDWCWSWSSNTLAPWCKEPTHWKDPDAGKDRGQEEKGMTEEEMVGWHHQLNRQEFEQALGVGDRQGSLMCCSPWGCKESDMTEWLNSTELNFLLTLALFPYVLHEPDKRI